MAAKEKAIELVNLFITISTAIEGDVEYYHQRPHRLGIQSAVTVADMIINKASADLDLYVGNDEVITYLQNEIQEWSDIKQELENL